MYQVSFQNKTKVVNSREEIEELRAKWCKGRARKLVERHFKIIELADRT